MKSLSLTTAGPFLLLTFIYFIVGFLTTVNGQCQGPLKIAFLSEATTMRNSLTTLISFAFFLGYLLNSSRTGRMLNLIGYKRTLIRSLIVMVEGLVFYTASAFCAEYAGDAGIVFNGDFVPFGYFVFLSVRSLWVRQLPCSRWSLIRISLPILCQAQVQCSE